MINDDKPESPHATIRRDFHERMQRGFSEGNPEGRLAHGRDPSVTIAGQKVTRHDTPTSAAHALRDGVLLTAISGQLPEGAGGEYWLTFSWGTSQQVGLVVEVVNGRIELRNGQSEAEFCRRLAAITGEIGSLQVHLTRPTEAERRAHVAEIAGPRPGVRQMIADVAPAEWRNDGTQALTVDTSGNVEPPTITGSKPNRAARRKAAKRKGRSRR